MKAKILLSLLTNDDHQENFSSTYSNDIVNIQALMMGSFGNDVYGIINFLDILGVDPYVGKSSSARVRSLWHNGYTTD